MNTLTDFQLGWVTGILEGEGYFLSRKGNPQVGCAMTDEDTIKNLRDLCGGRYCVQRYKKQPHWKDAYVWYLHGVAAEELMLAVLPHMSQRRKEKIETVLSVYKTHKEQVSDRKKEVSANGRNAGLAYNSGEGSLRQVARVFGVSQVTVLNYSRFLKGEDWKEKAGTGGRPE